MFRLLSTFTAGIRFFFPFYQIAPASLFRDVCVQGEVRTTKASVVAAAAFSYNLPLYVSGQRGGFGAADEAFNTR